jgi:hypothetical protein
MALANRREARRLLEAIRLATSSRNGLTSLLKISNGRTELGHILIVASVRPGPSSCSWRSSADGCRPAPNSARICSAVNPFPVARQSIPAIPEPRWVRSGMLIGLRRLDQANSVGVNRGWPIATGV